MVELSLLHKEIHRFNEITGLFFFFKNHKLILIFMYVSFVSPSICHEVMGPDAMTLVF